MRLAIPIAVAVLLASSSAIAAPASSVTQYGVTWTFDAPHEVGQFASGDYWVVGPVKITAVTPGPTGTRNGSSVNPRGGRQGYDDRGGEYKTDDNVAFPYTLKVDESLVSSVSKPDGGDFKNLGCLRSQAVLTAVPAPQKPTALRPAYAGTYKHYADTTSIRWSLLPKLPAPPEKPDGADLLRMAERPRIDHLSSWTIQDSCAEENWYNGEGAHACYGREYGTFVSEAAMYLMLDTPDRDALAISMIQLGIDNYGVLKAGGNWAPNGGHHNGRKWPILFAAQLLDDCDMLEFGAEYAEGKDGAFFTEDGHTYVGKNGKALFGWDCGGGFGSYFESGCSGSGAKDCRDPALAVDGCEDYRNCCTSAYWVGEALATHLTHARAIWNHAPFFDYVDRWMKSDVSGGGESSSKFIDKMWTLYRDKLPAGAEASTTCAPTSGDAGPTSDAATNPATDEASDGGCGCHTERRSEGAVLPFGLFVALALLRRRAASAVP